MKPINQRKKHLIGNFLLAMVSSTGYEYAVYRSILGAFNVKCSIEMMTQHVSMAEMDSYDFA